METRFYDPALFSLAKLHNRGANSEMVYHRNRRLILQLIKDEGVISRQSIVEKTGLKGATITIIINEFLKEGIVKKVGLMEGENGRRIMGFRFADEKFCSIAVRISTSYIKLGIYTTKNENLFVKKMFMDTLGKIDLTCQVIAEEIEQAKKIVADRIVMGVGVGVEGPYVIKDGYYKLFQPQRVEKYFDIGKVLAEKLGYPVIINKANNFAVYNTWKEESKFNPLGIFIYISISYTIECGIIVNGEILNGSSGTVGLLGDIPIAVNDSGKVMTLNDKCSTNATLNRVLECLDQYPESVLNGKSGNLNIRDVIKAFDEEDPLAVMVFQEGAEYLGQALGILVNFINPDYILIGDELPLNSRMLNILKEKTSKHCSREIRVNLHMPLLSYEKSRDTKVDPTLLGASSYVSDAYLQSMNFTEN